MTWKFLISAMLIVATGFVAYDILSLGANPIPFCTGVKEALTDMPEEANRKVSAWLGRVNLPLPRAI